MVKRRTRRSGERASYWLTPEQRAKTVWLHKWGCEVCHIAERLGVAEQTVRQILREAGKQQEVGG